MKKIANKGFTLIELLVVVAIIAILALVVLLALNPVEMARRSRDSRALSDLGTLRRAIDLTLADGTDSLKGAPGAGIFTKTTDAAAGSTVFDSADKANNLVGMNIGKYLSTIPQDPTYGTDAVTKIQTVAGTNCDAANPDVNMTYTKKQMVYTFTSNGSEYVLSAHLESATNCKAVSNDGKLDDLYELGTAPGLTVL
jgi:type IV pilus assembly protein PilA